MKYKSIVISRYEDLQVELYFARRSDAYTHVYRAEYRRHAADDEWWATLTDAFAGGRYGTQIFIDLSNARADIHARIATIESGL